MRFTKQSGQALLITAFALVVLTGFTGLAVDMGTLRYEKRLQQIAADASALAGASEIGYSVLGLSTSAQSAATQNGFTDGSSSDITQCDLSLNSTIAIGTTCVQVNNPPSAVSFGGNTITGGAHAGNSNYVEVLVAKVQPTFFMNIFGVSREAVLARAVATNTGGGAAAGGGCVYTLGTPAAKLKLSSATLGANGNVTINAPTCGIVDNGNFDAVGSVSLLAGSIGVGGQSGLPSQQPTSCSGFTVGTTGVCPSPTLNMPYSGDPIAGKYPIPSNYLPSRGPVKITGGTCNGAGCSPSGQTAITCGSGVCAVPAGTYDDLCIDNNQTVNFGAGLYVLTGASTCSNGIDFNVNASSTVCNSTNADCSGMVASQNAGVTFYLVGSNTANVNGTAQVQLAAPNSGTYAGLLFYQDPAAAIGTNMTLSGNSSSLYQGAIYGPTMTLSFGGNTNFNSGAAYTVIITMEMNTNGGPYINLASNFSGLASGGPLTGLVQWATLVE
jgi:hypothetical protein